MPLASPCKPGRAPCGGAPWSLVDNADSPAILRTAALSREPERDSLLFFLSDSFTLRCFFPSKLPWDWTEGRHGKHVVGCRGSGFAGLPPVHRQRAIGRRGCSQAPRQLRG